MRLVSRHVCRRITIFRIWSLWQLIDCLQAIGDVVVEIERSPVQFFFHGSQVCFIKIVHSIISVDLIAELDVAFYFLRIAQVVEANFYFFIVITFRDIELFLRSMKVSQRSLGKFKATQFCSWLHELRLFEELLSLIDQTIWQVAVSQEYVFPQALGLHIWNCDCSPFVRKDFDIEIGQVEQVIMCICFRKSWITWKRVLEENVVLPLLLQLKLEIADAHFLAFISLIYRNRAMKIANSS